MESFFLKKNNNNNNNTFYKNMLKYTLRKMNIAWICFKLEKKNCCNSGIMMWIITAYLHLQSEDLYFWLVIFLKYNFKVNLRNWSNYLVGSLLGNMCIHSLLRKVLSIHTFCAWEDKKKHNKRVMQSRFPKNPEVVLDMHKDMSMVKELWH